MLSAAVEQIGCADIPISVHAPKVQIPTVQEGFALPVRCQVLQDKSYASRRFCQHSSTYVS